MCEEECKKDDLEDLGTLGGGYRKVRNKVSGEVLACKTLDLQ